MRPPSRLNAGTTIVIGQRGLGEQPRPPAACRALHVLGDGEQFEVPLGGAAWRIVRDGQRDFADVLVARDDALARGDTVGQPLEAELDFAAEVLALDSHR